MAEDTLIDDAFRKVTMVTPTQALSVALIRETLPEPDPIEAAMEIARQRAAEKGERR